MRTLFPVSTDFAFPDNTFDDFFNGLFQPSPTTQYRLPKIDIEDAGKAYILTADLPGMTKEDISLTYANDVFTLRAQHQTEKETKPAQTAADQKDAPKAEEKQHDERHYIRRERSNLAYSRQFIIRNINRDGIEAAFENGVLTVTLPKLDPDAIQAGQRIDIK